MCRSFMWEAASRRPHQSCTSRCLSLQLPHRRLVFTAAQSSAAPRRAAVTTQSSAERRGQCKACVCMKERTGSRVCSRVTSCCLRAFSTTVMGKSDLHYTLLSGKFSTRPIIKPIILLQLLLIILIIIDVFRPQISECIRRAESIFEYESIFLIMDHLLWKKRNIWI